MTDLSRHDIRLRVFEALRHGPSTQWQNFVQYYFKDALGRAPNSQEMQTALEILHELMNAGILMPGNNPDNPGLGLFCLTMHGRDLLEKAGPPVYDYDGYLAELRKESPSLDETVVVFLSESLQAYHRTLYLSSLVMLACASERLIRLLIDAYVNSIADAKNREKLTNRLNGRDISEAFTRFHESFASTRNQISDTRLPNDFDLHVESVFTFIRVVRNSIVHSQNLPTVTSAIVYANLQQFSFYARTIVELITWFESNQTTV
jgi:hypothetical protein